MSQYEERESICNTTLIAASTPSKRKHKVEQLCWSVILYIENYYINIKFGKKKFENRESLGLMVMGEHFPLNWPKADSVY